MSMNGKMQYADGTEKKITLVRQKYRWQSNTYYYVYIYDVDNNVLVYDADNEEIKWIKNSNYSVDWWYLEEKSDYNYIISENYKRLNGLEGLMYLEEPNKLDDEFSVKLYICKENTKLECFEISVEEPEYKSDKLIIDKEESFLVSFISFIPRLIKSICNKTFFYKN